jgi:hypothetical protein
MNHYQITSFVKAQKQKNLNMKMDYTHYEQDKQTSKNMNQQNYDQTLTKQLAREMVGDGQIPNLWFVTYGPYIAVHDGDISYDFELIEGYDENKDTYTYGPFASYKDALKHYDEIELSFDYGIGQAFIEDRECGTITEKWLHKRVRIDYVQDEYDNSKRFYEKNKQTQN